MTDAPNADQRAFWSEQAGHKWVAQQQVMDQLLDPVLNGLLERAALRPGEHVLDIGCGAGTSTMRAAQQVGPDGSATGVDISDTLLALAQERAADQKTLTYLHADAATHHFDAHSFDHVISRFGVMFFEDTEAAFSNIINGLNPDANVTFATWGAIEHNPYFKLAAKAARDVLGPMPKSDPDAPGPFAMREPDRITPILEAAGLKDVAVDRQTLMLTPPGDLATFADICGQIGPAEAAMRHFGANQDQRAAVRVSLMKTFKPFEQTDGSVQIPAEILFYSAQV